MGAFPSTGSATTFPDFHTDQSWGDPFRHQLTIGSQVHTGGENRTHYTRHMCWLTSVLVYMCACPRSGCSGGLQDDVIISLARRPANSIIICENSIKLLMRPPTNSLVPPITIRWPANSNQILFILWRSPRTR